MALGEPLGWDISFKNNYLKQREYLQEINIPLRNHEKEFYFLDVFEHLVLLMIIRREVINFALLSGHPELVTSPEQMFKIYNENNFIGLFYEDILDNEN